MNAVEAMSANDGVARVLRVTTARDGEGQVLISVADTGGAIDPAMKERIFEPFFTTKPGGIGLGLSICRSIVEGHGGRLWVSQNEPRGSVFQFTVPT